MKKEQMVDVRLPPAPVWETELIADLEQSDRSATVRRLRPAEKGERGPTHGRRAFRFLAAPLAVSLLCACATAVAQQKDVSCPIKQGFPTSNVLQRVFPIRIGDELGTAFTLEVRGRQYIVTAGHILTGDVPAEVHAKLVSDEWVRIPVRLVGRGEHQDVLVLAADLQLTTRFPVDAETAGMIAGQRVRFLGFMPGLETMPGPGYERGMPLVMGGILSGFHKDGSLLIDGHNNKGFSGGPVVYQPVDAPTLEECRWRVAGIITGYLPAPVVTIRDVGVFAADGQPVIANSGLMVAAPISAVLELVAKDQKGNGNR